MSQQTSSPKTLHVASSHPLGAVTAEEAYILEKLDLSQLPRHVAVIMDGNGRWAQRRHLPRMAGHKAGTETARTTIETCARLKIEGLTLYAFSMENWRRPKAETDFLMQLLQEYLRQEMPLIQKNNIRMRFLGRADDLPEGVRRDTREAEVFLDFRFFLFLSASSRAFNSECGTCNTFFSALANVEYSSLAIFTLYSSMSISSAVLIMI